MNDRTFKSSKWLVGAARGIILLTLVTMGSNAWAQTTSENAPTNSPPIAPPSSEALAVVDQEVPEDLSPGLAEIVRLIQARVGDEVIVAYIKNSATAYHPTADEILYLNDLGVSDSVLTALLGHNGESAPASADPPATDTTSKPPVPSSQVSTNGAPAPNYTVSSSPESTAPGSVATVVATPTVVAAPATVVVAPPSADVVYFQDSLSPYGTWVYVDGYGWCWQPTVVRANPAWMPYCDRGRWIYTDCGWYWESDYSWGWAPFHYGRWSRHDRYGWVWFPDRVWGPSWVSWRHHDTYCGWAPLPPAARFQVGVGFTFHNGHVGADFDFGLSAGCFTFVSYDHFRDPHPGRYRVPHREVGGIYHRSTVVNNYTVINKTIINEGVGRERVSRLTHQPINPVSVRPVESRRGPGRAEHLENGGRTLAVYRPPATAPRASGPDVAAARNRMTINHPSQPIQAGPQTGPQGQPSIGNRGGRSQGNPNAGARGPAMRPDSPGDHGNQSNSRNPGRSGRQGNRNEVPSTPSTVQPATRNDGRPTPGAAPRVFTPPQTPAGPRNPMGVPSQGRPTSPSDSGRSFTPASPAPSPRTDSPARIELPTSSARPASRAPAEPATSAPTVRPTPSRSPSSDSPSPSVRPERSERPDRPERSGNGNRPL